MEVVSDSELVYSESFVFAVCILVLTVVSLGLANRETVTKQQRLVLP